jgi:hypothetical protein
LRVRVCHFFGKILRPWCAGEDCGSGLRVDGLQNPNSAGVGECGFPQIERQFLLRECRSFLFPETAKFVRPWSGKTPFQLENNCIRSFFKSDSQHLLARLAPRQCIGTARAKLARRRDEGSGGAENKVVKSSRILLRKATKDGA